SSRIFISWSFPVAIRLPASVFRSSSCRYLVVESSSTLLMEPRCARHGTDSCAVLVDEIGSFPVWQDLSSSSLWQCNALCNGLCLTWDSASALAWWSRNFLRQPCSLQDDEGKPSSSNQGARLD
ncbi:hypothetical protein T310_9076, partial [Rasamsonia emersonii CBS 393.64]